MDKFIVSARKYRPATFASVVGQMHITSTLQNAIAREQLAHAYLFCGPRGVGKTTCARIVAKTVNCLNRTPENESCNQCDSCVAFDEGTSFSIHELDAASNTSVENIRSLNQQVMIMPQIGKYSIYIIDEVHMLSTSAFNAFLKTLEEPPAHVIFILATTEKHKILPTILSRCQTYEFKRITLEDMVKYLQHISLKENVQYDDQSLHLIASKADGCMRDALSMYDKVVSFCGSMLSAKEVSIALNILDYDTYFQFISMLKLGDYQSALLKYDDILQKGFDTQSFIGGLCSHIRNILVAQNDRTGKLLEVTGTVALRYQEQAKELDLTFIFKSLSILTSLEGALKTTLNQRLTCEIAILKLCNISEKLIAPTSLLAIPLPQPIIEKEKKNSIIPKANVAQTDQQVVSQAIATVQQVGLVDTKAVASIDKPVETTIEPKRTDVKVRSRQGGFSIKDIKENLNSGKIKQAEQENLTVNEDVSVSITSDNERAVLDGCIIYAEKIQDKKIRIALVLKKATIEDGKIAIIVPSNILQEEIIKQKHELLAGIKDICDISGLDFKITVDESQLMQEKQIYVKSEDKLGFLMEHNSNLQPFMKDLGLHLE